MTLLQRSREGFEAAAAAALAGSAGEDRYAAVRREAHALRDRASAVGAETAPVAAALFTDAAKSLALAMESSGTDDSLAFRRLVAATAGFEAAIAEAMKRPEGQALAARDDMIAARAEAEAAGANSAAKMTYEAAMARAAEADGHWQSGRVMEAAGAFAAAGALFTQAAQEAELSANPARVKALEAQKAMQAAKARCERSSNVNRSYFDLGARAEKIAVRYLGDENYEKALSNFETATRFYTQAAGG
jgi:hypothetical protein